MPRPKCPKCISPELAPYYNVRMMKTAYQRDLNGVFRKIGYYCEKHEHFIPGKKS